MSSFFQNRRDYFKKETSPTYLRIEMGVLAGMPVPRIDVDGMTCAVCVSHVEKAILSVPEVESAAVNLALSSAEFNGKASIDDVVNAINKSGYVASVPVEFTEKLENMKKEANLSIYKSTPGLIIALIIMFYVMSGGEEKFHLVAFLCVIVLDGWKVIVKGIHSLRYGVNMYTLIFLAFISGLSWSLYEPNDAMWEATYIVIAFVAFGDSIELNARLRATNSFADLASQRIVGEHNAGDEILIAAGSIVPVDGKVIKGKSQVDQAAITGESLPVLQQVGDIVWAGSICLDSSLTIEAITNSGSSRIDEVVRLVEKAQSEKAEIERLVDRIASIFVPLVVLLAIISAVIWYSEGLSAKVAVSVLVIACPCAMGLATPISLFVATSTGAKHGILLKGHKAIESGANVENIVIDKTGTITEGRLQIEYDSEEALRIAAALEAHTSHPIAVAILRECSDYPDATEVETIPGWGLTGKIEGIIHSVGKGDNGIEVKRGDDLIGIIRIHDQIRDDAKDAIKLLPNVILSSGDSEEEVKRVAEELNIQDARHSQTPTEKLDLVESMENVAMVGDGINDAAALASADLGIAVAMSTGLADISSDIILTKDGLMTCVNALNLAKRTRVNIRQNLFWAFSYNVIAIPIAMGALYPINGFLLPAWAAAAAMAMSSLTVVLNSLRLKWSFEKTLF